MTYNYYKERKVTLPFGFYSKNTEIATPFDRPMDGFERQKHKKPMYSIIRNKLFLLLLLIFGAATASAQTADFKLKVKDETGRNRSGIWVNFYEISDDQDTAGTLISTYTDSTDADGNYSNGNIKPAKYKVVLSSEIYAATEYLLVQLISGANKNQEMTVQKIGTSGIVRISMKREGAIRMNETKSVVTGSQLINSARGDVFTATVAGVTATTQGVSIRGTRADGNGTYVDGVRVIGSGTPNTLGIDAIAASIGGIRAMFGDLTGGAFEYTTRSATSKFRSAVQGTTSQNLDAYGFSSLDGFMSGPLIKKRYKDESGKTKELLKLGYVASGSVTYAKDNSPTINGVYYVNEEKQKELEENPLVIIPGNFVHKANYLTESDLKRSKSRLNAPLYQGNFWGKLEFRPNNQLTVTAYGSYFYNWGINASNSIMNYENSARFDNRTIRSYLLLNQNFKTPKNGTIRNAFYQVRVEYQNVFGRARDANHLDNIFDYGYIGRFTGYKTEFFGFEQSNPDPRSPRKKYINQYGDTVYVNNFYKLVGYADTALKFDPSDKNKLRARYTQSLFDYFNSRNFKIQNTDVLQSVTGLRNGDNMPSVYNLWSVPGTVTSNYGKNLTEKYSVFTMGQMEVKPKTLNGIERAPHALQAGLYFEQLVARGYSVGANGLWGLMRQLLNKQIDENIDDTKNETPHAILSYDANGNFTDTVRFAKLINASEQSTFDKNFRKKLISQGAKDVYGKKIDEYSYLSSDNYTPEDFEMNMFSADELLNNGNSLINYYGYDYLGNKVKGKPSIEEFLNNKEKRTIGAYQPVYIAAWLEDQFQFKDLIFRFGLRMERFDANQLVLKDPYSLYPIKTAGEINNKTVGGQVFKKPSNIGDDYAVYVNDIESYDKVVGYRNGDKWYDADGTELLTPEPLANATKNGRIAPLLSNPNNQTLTKDGLKDFTPLVNLLPRIWFSFPLERNKKSFYISYDVLAQRPNSGASFLTIDELYYLRTRQGSTISNGDLKSRIKTDYEVGYKQAFGKGLKQGLELSASYSEIRKDFGLYQINQGYPVTYNTFRNIDFATITGFRGTYLMDQIGPMSLQMSYQYQLADGTGSNINSQATLIASGQPNLRNVIPLGELDIRHSLKGSVTFAWGGKGIDPVTKKKIYTGPMVGKTEIFRNTSFNLIANASSGGPYTPASNAVQIGSLDRQQIKGEPYGARMPWTYTLDINITKGFEINRSTKNPLRAFFFFTVNNILNTYNVAGVYRFTGEAKDDGYLNSPQGQQAIQNQISSQGFVDLYKTFLNSNAGFGAPRTIRMGLRLFLNQ